MGKYILFEVDETRQPKAGEWYLFKDLSEGAIKTPCRCVNDWTGDDAEMPILKRHEFDNVEELTGWAIERSYEEGTQFGEVVLESTPEPSRRERIATEVLAGLLSNSDFPFMPSTELGASFDLPYKASTTMALRYADLLLAELDKGDSNAD